MNRYRGGADFEREVRAALVKDGYDVVRSAGSKTKVDLVAFKAGHVLLVQCKRNGVCPPAERIELLRIAWLLPVPIGLPIVASRPGITYRRLYGPGPKQWDPWTTDEAAR